MPLINQSNYTNSPRYLINGHFETIVPSIFNKVEDVIYHREQLELSDGDFLDLDWKKANNDRLVILSHGMEGSSKRHYIKRSAKFFNRNEWDVLAWNNRGCGGTINRLIKSYHHGTVQDIKEVIDYALTKREYKSILLIGFSMGGSMVSKYLSVTPQLNDRIKGGIAFSVSCDLHDTVLKLEQGPSIYKKRFLSKLRRKLLIKQEMHSELAGLNIERISTFEQYHNEITIPIEGYVDLDSFYKDASCMHHLPSLQKPLLMVNALNDPLLGKHCYPIELAKSHDLLFMETPKRGGHLGFTLNNSENSYMETSALLFIANHLG